jgi:hypothetical protein
MEVVQTARHPQDATPPSPETIWAILRENSEGMKELRESQKETDRIMRESKADFNARLGEYINLFGEVTEYMMAPKLREKFLEFGLDFPQTSRNTKVNDRVNGISFETDAKLENGDKVMVVEVKTQLTLERINKHIERLEKMRAYANLHGDKRSFLGAVAGVVVTDEVRNYALSQGFYVIEPSGEDLNITPPNGPPKEW